MATINSKKLLPPSKSSLNAKNKKILIPASNIRVKKNVKSSSEDLKKEGSGGISSDSLLGIKDVISKIQDVLLRSSIFQKKEQDNKRKGQERETRKRRESKLEKKPTDKNIASGIASLPNLSFIDRIKKFLFWTILGRLFSDLFPKLVEFSKRIVPIVDFVENFAGNILKGVVDFIDWGYIAYDKVRDLTKQIGGENAQKTFDDFSKHFNTFLNLALIAAMAGSGIGRGGDTPGKPGKPGKPGRPGQYGGGGGGRPTAADRTRNARIRNIQRQYGPSARKIYENALNNGKTPQQAEAAIKRGFKKGVSIRAGADSLAAKTAKKGSLFKRGLRKLPARLATKTLGKAGIKIAGKALGRIPIIGGLVDFLFALWSGEKPGRAAAKAVGATIGSALGTFIPIPLAGTILGGILGDIVGGALYDTLVTNNNKKVQKKAKGGNITRGGKRVGRSNRRSIKVSKVKKPNKIVPQRTIVGKDVGGKNKIEDIYGKGSKKKRRNPIKLLKKASRAVKKNDNVLNGLPAAMFGAGIDMTLGQKPDKNLSIDIGNMFGSIIQTSVNSEISKLFTDVSSILTRAEGGTIPESRNLKLNNSNLDIGKKVGNEISQKLISSINSSVNDVFQSLNREFGIKDKEDASPPSGGGGGGGGLDGIDQMSSLTGIHKQAADIIAGYESATSGGYNAMNRGEPGDSPEGPMHYFGKNLTDMTIGEVVGLQSQGRSKLNAAGRYQFVGNTLPTAMRDANLKPSDRFSPLNQDKMFVAHLIKNGHRPWTGSWGMGKYSRQQLDILDRAVKTPITGETFNGYSSDVRMTKGAGTFIQGNTGDSRGDHFHIGPTEYRDEGKQTDRGKKDAREAAFHVAKALIAKKIPFYLSNYTGFKSPWYAGKGDNKSDQELRNAILAEQNGHRTRPGGGSWGGIDIATAYGTRLPVAVGPVKDKGDGFGYAAIISGTRGFVGHGAEGSRQTKSGEIAIQEPSKPKPKPNPQPKPGTQALNYGATWNSKTGFTLKGGGWLGLDSSLTVTDTERTKYREIPQFGLGRGSKEGEKKKAADGNFYEWKKGKWILWNPAGPGANASLPTSSLSQSIAQVSGKYTDNLVIQRVIINRQVPVPVIA